MSIKRRLRRCAAVACVGLMAVVSWQGVGSAAPAEREACPSAVPVAALSPGMTGTGLTVERGTTPDEFSAEVVGVIDDGIAPDMDMIIVDTDSPAIQRAGGIWAGMSGSPVYSDDGRLIGAVAYGLSLAPSSIAGLVPAEDMLRLLDRPGAAPMDVASAERAAIPQSMQRRMVSAGVVSSAQADDGMRRLPLPVAVAGLADRRIAAFSEEMAERVPNTRVFAAGANSGASSTPADIFPGSNFVAAQSYGDLTSAAVGTTTAVCDGDVSLAFGHPFAWTGRSSMSAHPADAVFVQRDNTVGSYKLANPLGVVGTIDQDRLAGVRAQLGTGPATTSVTSTVAAAEGVSRDGTTEITTADFVPFLSSFHLLANLDRVGDFIGGGTSKVRWVIDGTRASGQPFRVAVANRYASPWDISWESIWDSWNQLERIHGNRFEKVSIDDVRYDATIADEFKRYTVGAVFLKRPDGSLVRVSSDRALRVPTGSRLNLRVMLNQYQNAGPRGSVDLSLAVPAGAAGRSGRVNVVGGRNFDGGVKAKTFDDLLTNLRKMPRNDAVTATLSMNTRSGFTQRRARALADQVVEGRFAFPIRVVAADRSLPAVVDGKTWKLRSSLTSGPPTRKFRFGNRGFHQLMGDFNGNGKTSPALFKDGTWRVKMFTVGRNPRVFTFGQPGDTPVVGDWNGDGKDGIGVYRDGRWLLRETATGGDAHRDFRFGHSAAVPVAGDWNGNGRDGIGTFRDGWWRLRNAISSGPPARAFGYGVRAGDRPVVGDWNRDGRDRPGFYRAGRWHISNKLVARSTWRTFDFGWPRSRPVTWHN